MIIKTGLIPRVAFTILGIDIYWYAILIVIGIALGIIICKIKDGKFGIKFDDILNLSLVMIPVAFICARIYYVVFSLEYYTNNVIEIFNIKDGGLGIYGGIIGAVFTIIVYCKIKKINFLDLLDYLAPCLALGQAIGRWGNYTNIEAYGLETTLPLKMQIIEDGITKYVHPTFLYESLVTFSISIILTILSNRRKFSGQITYLYIIMYCFARMFIESIRTDSLMLYNFKISLILSLILFVVFSFIFGFNIYKNYKRKMNVEKCRKRSHEKRLKRLIYPHFLLTNDKKYVIILLYERELNRKKGSVIIMLNDRICQVREKLNKSIATGEDYEIVYNLSLELDELIAEHYRNCKEKTSKKEGKNTKERVAAPRV